MARVAKFTCIFLPYLLTIGAFICLTLVGLGMKYKSGVMQRFYFFDVCWTLPKHLCDLQPLNLQNLPHPLFLQSPSFLRSQPLTSTQLNLVEFKNKIFQSSEAKLLLQGDLYDWYATGLWNSCYGQVSTNGTRVVVGCTAAHQRYWFNPFEAPGISEIITLLKVDMSSALNIYHRASTALFYLWVFSLVFVLVQALAGFTSLFGHGWGILVSMVTMVSNVLGSAGEHPFGEDTADHHCSVHCPSHHSVCHCFNSHVRHSH